ncbi:MAG: ribonuclease III [Pseudomonadota bacterium]
MRLNERGNERLEAVLGYRFGDRRLMDRALVHRSAGTPTRRDNERLEFLGDRVLGLAVADLLWRAFPNEPEGGLSKRHAALVRRETLADVGVEWALGDDLVLSPGETAAGGRDNPAIVADGVEALIGAVYADGGFGPAADLVRRFWQARVADLRDVPHDAKTALQEWSQGRGLGLPVYREEHRSGPPHAPTFTVSARVGHHAPMTASGASKRLAEQAAAAALLRALDQSGR